MASDEIKRGQRWECYEGRASTPVHDFGAEWSGLGPRFVCFRAVVEHVDGDYVVLRVTVNNDHLKSPDFGAEIVKSATRLHEETKWRCVSRAPSERVAMGLVEP